MEHPDVWLSRQLAVAFFITTLDYRCVESYEKMLDVEYKFGNEFNFTNHQLSHVALPPIAPDERIDVICIYDEYKRLDRLYWTT